MLFLFQDFFELLIPYALHALTPFPKGRNLRAPPTWVPPRATERCPRAQRAHLIDEEGTMSRAFGKLSDTKVIRQEAGPWCSRAELR